VTASEATPVNEGTLAEDRKVERQGAALAVGVVPNRGDARHAGLAMGGLAKRSVLQHKKRKNCPFRANLKPERHGLPETRQNLLLDPRVRCPKDREKPHASHMGFCLGFRMGVKIADVG